MVEILTFFHKKRLYIYIFKRLSEVGLIVTVLQLLIRIEKLKGLQKIMFTVPLKLV